MSNVTILASIEQLNTPIEFLICKYKISKQLENYTKSLNLTIYKEAMTLVLLVLKFVAYFILHGYNVSRLKLIFSILKTYFVPSYPMLSLSVTISN